MALPRNKRIVRDQDFAAIVKGGKTVRGSFFFLKFKPRSGAIINRFAVVVPSKAAPRAVRRNAIRRALSEEYRLIDASPRGIDVVCFVQKDPGEDLAPARKELRDLLVTIL